MQFDYEISVEDFVASQTLYFGLSTRPKRVAVRWIIAGAFFILVAFMEPVFNWTKVLLAATGGWWIFGGFANLFPGRYLRRSYGELGLAGEKFHADLNEEGFEVVGHLRRWHVRWEGVSLKGEDEHVFMLYSAGTVFMFGKKYLTDEQQCELRRFAAL